VNKRIKKLRVEALRSGKYEQANGQLQRSDKFCCLGVLCDLYAKEIGERPYDDEQGDLPGEVCQWAGLESLDSDPFLGKNSAATHNDGNAYLKPKDFIQISNLIQRYL